MMRGPGRRNFKVDSYANIMQALSGGELVASKIAQDANVNVSSIQSMLDRLILVGAVERHKEDGKPFTYRKLIDMITRDEVYSMLANQRPKVVVQKTEPIVGARLVSFSNDSHLQERLIESNRKNRRSQGAYNNGYASIYEG